MERWAGEGAGAPRCRFALTDLVGSYSAPKPDAANVGTLRGSWVVSFLGCRRDLPHREGLRLQPSGFRMRMGGLVIEGRRALTR